MIEESLRVDTFTDDLRSLSASQAASFRHGEDPLIEYCRQLETQIVEQSEQIEALRQMLRSEHERHARGPAGLPPLWQRFGLRRRGTAS
jgi:hypothetical protein